MCGIVGISAIKGNIVPDIIHGLKNLEYRGYDSAGIACIINQQFNITKIQGKIAALEQEIAKYPIDSHLGIGHTRWATHGVANNINAHPHQTSQVSVVHNGIIENFIAIKQELIGKGHEFVSETDSEVIPHLITYYLNQKMQPVDAVRKAISRLEGAFAIAVIFLNHSDLIIAARKGSPLVIGYNDECMIVASDSYALAFLTNKISYLEEGDIAVIHPKSAKIYDHHHNIVKRNIVSIESDAGNLGKGNFRHYMLKEIFEQPIALANVINAYYDHISQTLTWPNLNIDLSNIPKITLVACGTSYYASMVAKYWLEKLVGLPVEVDIASEFRYRNCHLPEKALCIFISQSGETADTLAALRYAQQHKQITLGIVNVKESSIAREADYTLQCFAGPEIGVASTKAFTSQLVVLLMLSLDIALKNGKITKEEFNEYFQLIIEVPGRVSDFLNHADTVKSIALEISKAQNALFIGRNYIYPIALEGALKLKELSYIHAEAIAAGELKHGPIALVDADLPIIVLAPQNSLFDKTCSNAHEIAARGGKLITISSGQGNKILQDIAIHQLNVNSAHYIIDPIIYAIPMQLIAYYVAVIRGTDVDQPRNLAKSVTVE